MKLLLPGRNGPSPPGPQTSMACKQGGAGTWTAACSGRCAFSTGANGTDNSSGKNTVSPALLPGSAQQAQQRLDGTEAWRLILHKKKSSSPLALSLKSKTREKQSEGRNGKSTVRGRSREDGFSKYF